MIRKYTYGDTLAGIYQPFNGGYPLGCTFCASLYACARFCHRSTTFLSVADDPKEQMILILLVIFVL